MFSPLRHLASRTRSPLVRGSALVETLVALVIVAVFLSGTYASNFRIWGLVRSGLESNGANRTLNGRAEQLRAATWNQVVDPTYLRDSIFGVPPDAGGDLGSLVETIDITAYPAPQVSVPPMQVTRNNTTGTATITVAGDGTMSAQASARINVKANWTAKGGQTHVRQITLLFAPGGVSGRK